VTLDPIGHIKALASTWRGRFILAFVIVQMALPLAYYTVRRDKHDERYAWRMFSPMRMTTCSVAATVDKQPVNLGGEFHEAWIGMAERGRFVVAEAMARRLCEKNQGKAVEMTLDCKYIDRAELAHFGGHDMCTQPEL
jgi:hypothetical protein